MLRVDAQADGHRSDLVSERDLDGVEGVAGVLDHLGGVQRNEAGGDRQPGIEIGDAAGGDFVGTADYEQRRLQKVLYGGAFAKEFGIGNDTAHGVIAERFGGDIVTGSGENGASNGNDERCGAVNEELADFVADPAELFQAHVAVTF